jgi:nitrate/nitrite-specific signal transduction histidine kinase
MSEEKKEEGLTLDKKTMDVLVANIIPTSKYFEIRFDHMQEQIDDLKVDLKDFRGDVDKRFDNIKTDMDKRFEQVDRRFEQVDKRFEQIIASIDRLGDKLEHRDEKQRSFTLRMFTIAISISIIGVLGAFLKSLGVF